MSETDRDFNQSKRVHHWTGNQVWHLLEGPVLVGTWSGVRLRIHASLLWSVALVLLAYYANQTLGWRVAAAGLAIFLFNLPLHAEGHRWASSLIGGNPGQMVLWPLGGVSLPALPRQPGVHFIIALGGPLVNLLLCAGATAILAWIQRTPWEIGWNLLCNPALVLELRGAAYVVAWVLLSSEILLLVNLLPILPLDGGQMLQAALWPRLGYYRSMKAACLIGMLCAVGLGIAVLRGPIPWALSFVAAALFLPCFKHYLILRQVGPEGLFDERELTSDAEPPTPHRRRKLSRRLIVRARRRAQRDQAELDRIDLILAKVWTRGIQSLSWSERRTLHRATERRRRSEGEPTP